MSSARSRHWFRLVLVTLGMFGFGFAMVPLYNSLCYAMGLNGRIENKAATAAAKPVDQSRQVTVEFVTTVNGGRSWVFQPDQPRTTLHPGEYATVSFLLHNTQDQAITAQAVPNIAPPEAAQYLHKTECFCFSQQAFKAGEQRHMPVVFTIDPAMPKDIDHVTLSYTFFDVTQVAHAAN